MAAAIVVCAALALTSCGSSSTTPTKASTRSPGAATPTTRPFSFSGVGVVRSAGGKSFQFSYTERLGPAYHDDAETVPGTLTAEFPQTASITITNESASPETLHIVNNVIVMAFYPSTGHVCGPLRLAVFRMGAHSDCEVSFAQSMPPQLVNPINIPSGGRYTIPLYSGGKLAGDNNGKTAGFPFLDPGAYRGFVDDLAKGPDTSALTVPAPDDFPDGCQDVAYPASSYLAHGAGFTCPPDD